jgi:hypothetical protein
MQAPAIGAGVLHMSKALQGLNWYGLHSGGSRILPNSGGGGRWWMAVEVKPVRRVSILPSA